MEKELSPLAFSAQLEKTKHQQIIDVRTPDEYNQGHIINAINIDWNSGQFENEISKLDKTKPIFVYCLSGGRSIQAARKIRQMGFKHIVGLKGGMLNWRNANLPETITQTPVSNGLSLNDYRQKINNENYVLVDFYANWCVPCKQLTPILEKIKNEKNQVQLLRINVDQNPNLTKTLKISALPAIKLYKKGKLIWAKEGFAKEDEIIQQLK
jgi:thioredoxin